MYGSIVRTVKLDSGGLVSGRERLITLPGRDEMRRRLSGVSADPAAAKVLAGELAREAGREFTPLGVANVLYLAIGGYLDDRAGTEVAHDTVVAHARPYLDALVDEEDREEVFAHLESYRS